MRPGRVNALKEKLKTETILMDGAMGTYYTRLYPDEGEAEAANIDHLERIQDIHKQYLQAGARMIRTNTFAVNHLLFGEKKDRELAIGHAVMSADLAVKAFQIEEAEKGKELPEVFIAGSIGPVRANAEQTEEEIFVEYQDICDSFLNFNIEIFVLETFADTGMVLKIAEYLRKTAKEKYDRDVFVLAQFSVNRMGYTKYGYGMQRLVRELEQTDLLDGFGFNCGIGVTHMNQMLSQLSFSKESVFSVLPNAGYEHVQSGRQTLIDHPAYYAATMEQILDKGVNLIGGCCGTTPDYTKALADILKKRTIPAKKRIVTKEDSGVMDLEPNPFMEKLNRKEKVYVVEIDSPFDQNADKFLEAAYRLKENEVDLVTISDSPMARPRAEAFEMGIYIANQTGIRVMPHVCCRDRNLIALRSAILGGHINGIRDMLVITGDPVARDDRNIITGVFDLNSIKLMDYVKNMNQEIFGKEPVYYGGALNYAGVNIDAIANRMKKKMEAGCSYFLTQPVYSAGDIQRVKELKERTDATIILGIMPLVSRKNALFMKNELPGIDVPEEIIEQYQPDMSRMEAEEVATRISVDIARQAFDFADGFYFMTPFNRVSLINGIISRIRELG